MSDPQPKYARVDTQNPEAWAQCDRCGFWYNRSKLDWQYEWAGMHIYNTGKLVCTTGNGCYDIPQEQFRTIILPPDPPPIINSRVPDFAYEEQTVIQLQFGADTPLPPWGAGPQSQLTTEDGQTLMILQYLTTAPTMPS